MSLRDQILAADDRPLKPVVIPEWNATVYVATLTVDEIAGGKDMSLTDLALLTLRDEQGTKVFTADDLPALKGGKSYRAVNRVLDTFIEVNGLSKDAVEKAKNG